MIAETPTNSITDPTESAEAQVELSSTHNPIDKETLRELMQPSFWRWSVRVAFNWSLIVGAMLLVGYTQHWAAYVFAIVVIGICQHRVALMAHEGVHRQITKHKKLNDFLTGFFCLWPVSNSVGGYRRFHFTHHRCLNTEDDVELHQKAKSSPAWDLPASRWTILKYIIQDVFLLHTIELLRLSNRAKPGTTKMDETLPLIWLLTTVGTLIYLGLWWVIVVWYLATAMIFWPIFRLRVWTEHVGTAEAHRITAPWYIRFWWLPHNTWCHYEHHHYPQVPCWHLPKVRELMGDSPPIVPLKSLFDVWENSPPISSGDTAPPQALAKT